MYHIKTEIVLRLLNITKRTLYNYRYGYWNKYGYHEPIMDIGDVFVVMVNHRQVSYMTQSGFESILNN